MYVCIYLSVLSLSWSMPGLFRLLVAACGILFPNQESNHVLCIGSMESLPLDHQGSPVDFFLCVFLELYWASSNHGLSIWAFKSSHSTSATFFPLLLPLKVSYVRSSPCMYPLCLLYSSTSICFILEYSSDLYFNS